MCEEGYAFPGSLVVGADSHSNMYGGLGCLGTPIVRTDAAAIWATQQTWWAIPPVAKVSLSGELLPGVTGKDVIITLCGLFNKDEVLNHAVEFAGDGIEKLSIDDRLTIANMTTEWGALAGVFPIDKKTVEWVKWRQQQSLKKKRSNAAELRFTNERLSKLEQQDIEQLSPAKGAFYNRELSLDLSTVRPHVSGPNHVKVMESVQSIEKRNVKIHKAYIVSCVNSRVEDLGRAAAVLKGKSVAPGVELYVAAASTEVQEESSSRGDWKTLMDAGARPLPAGCGPCIGLGKGLLGDGEVGISATNRNFKGRMGSRDAIAYLASPEVVAASAVKGFIAAPDYLITPSAVSAGGHSLKVNQKPSSGPAGARKLQPGFPKTIEGEVLFLHQDNLNTDGIYAGKWTYTEVAPEKQADVAMENYDPNFQSIALAGDIIVGGFNFGTGSSREQAVTALKHKGIRLILSGSFSETYTRNAWNNGFICIEVPQLAADMKQKFGSQALTVRTGLRAVVDFEQCTVKVDGKSYSIASLGSIVQELIIDGGLENWVKKNASART